MKAYLIVTGTIFGPRGCSLRGTLCRIRGFLDTTLGLFLVGGALAVWAARLLVSLRGPSA